MDGSPEAEDAVAQQLVEQLIREVLGGEGAGGTGRTGDAGAAGAGAEARTGEAARDKGRTGAASTGAGAAGAVGAQEGQQKQQGRAGSVIVYVHKRVTADVLAARLVRAGFRAAAYRCGVGVWGFGVRLKLERPWAQVR